jgi:hypothetical protein
MENLGCSSAGVLKRGILSIQREGSRDYMTVAASLCFVLPVFA